VARLTKQFGDADVTRPAYWRGYRLVPLEIEFWRSGAFRLHDRIVFRRASTSAPWTKTRLYP
jgi:pyridoxamine 5'-phosphate oxidase